MSRWFRHYAGMCRDEKLVRVALRAKQPIERVVWVYGAILESATEIDDGGRYELDTAEVAYFLRADEVDIERIVICLGEAQRLSEGRVARWGDRQFQSDRSAERQKRYRERRSQGHSDDNRTLRDVGVTSPSRHGDAPEADTKTDTEAEQKTRAPAKSSLEQDCRSLVGEEPVLLALDFHVIERLVEGGDVTPDDVKAGIRAAMERPNFRIRHWSQLEGWARGAAKDRLAGKSKAVVGKPVLVPATPEERDAALAKQGQRWVEYDTDEWVPAAEKYKAEKGNYPPHPNGGWYFPERYFASSEAAA